MTDPEVQGDGASTDGPQASLPTEAAPIRVVIDTSVLRQVGGDLTRGDWPSFLAAARLGVVSLHLPIPVLHELVDLRKRDLARLSKLERDATRLRTQLMDASELTHQPRKLSAAQVLELSSRYRDELIAWFGQAGSILDEPAVTHTELVERILAKRRPFNESERGYRDALIWYSTLECAAVGDVVLLTANTKDFATRDDDECVLAEDLQADLRERHLPDGRITLVTSTSALLQQVLPNWDEPAVAGAWSSFASSSLVRPLDKLLDERLSQELTSAPDVPSFLWHVGIRSIDAVTAVTDVRVVDDGDGWSRVHARLSTSSRVGGYVWAWGDPDGDLEDFALWDSWGGLTDYYASTRMRPVDVVVAARFRPLVEMTDLDVVEASPAERPPGGSDVRCRIHRSLQALLEMLQRYIDNEAFLADIFERMDEFGFIVSGIVADWEQVADTVPGRYQTLVLDNLPIVLEDVAGLRALRRDLEGAVAALEDLDDVLRGRP